ncbi:nicotinate-nucleotide--dimethylbenzimidazole phosphoribosyltransferase [Streptomyces sp. NBC_00647]|uniref:nicotinate-nucleotide--dimethylbenzimidazole phosphoribosyltransferase n=1 Tax=Streptomyces sp. NBC_00647 TaxID=2975796 RepID=UPI0032541F62
MTDTGQVPGEGLPENAGMVEQPGVTTPGAYTYLDPSDSPAEDDDLLLMPGAPGAQGAWGNEVPPPAPMPFTDEPGPHETAGRDSGAVDLGAVRAPNPVPVPQPVAPRRPLHLGPPTPDGSSSPVRSLADRGPAGARPGPMAAPVSPVRHAGPPTAGPEYLDVAQLGEAAPQGAVPWGTPPVGFEATAAETVVPEAGPLPASALDVEAGPVPEPQAAEAEQVPGFVAAPFVHDQALTPDTALTPDAALTPDGAQAPMPQTHEAPLDLQDPADEQAPEPVPATDGSPAAPLPDAPQFADVAQIPDAPHTLGAPATTEAAEPAGSAEPTGGDAQVSAHDATPVQIPADVEQVAPAQDLAPAEDVAAAQAPQAVPPQIADQETHAADPAEPVAADAEFAEPAVHMPEPAVRFADAVPQPETEQPPAAPHVFEAPESALSALSARAAEASHGGPGIGLEGFQAQQFTDRAAFAENGSALSGDATALSENGAFAHNGVVFPEPSGNEALHGVPVGVTAHAEVSHGEQHHPGALDAAAAPGHPGAPFVPQGDQGVGRFVPVDGTVPTTPHLAPTPPHAMTVPPLPFEEEQPPAQEPAEASIVVAPAPVEETTEGTEETVEGIEETAEGILETSVTEAEPIAPAPVPAPREAEALPEVTPEPAPVPELAVEPEPVVAQQAEDLRTQVADQEESTAVVEDVRESTGPAAPGYDDAEREAVLRVMRERRDIRNGFRSDPIPHDVLLRVLEAAHTAPSVGHSQPWDFVVIRSADTRRGMHELAQRQREAYAKSLPKGRAKQFKELKIEAILDTPVNIVVTADPTRGGRHTLGRHTQPQMAPYSSALAVENLWLAARAEGLGVGWVSFFDEREMVRALGLPEHLDVVAYLCVGYVDEFPDEPELMQAGWSKRRPLSWVVHEETYGRRALPGEEPHDLLAETVSNIRPLDAKALGEAWERQKRMTKPAGALGMLEIISAQLSGLSRMCPPPIPEPAAVAIFAGDHGVHAQGVTPWPQEVTGQMVANFLGGGAVCNAFANQVGAEVCVIDVGVASDLPATPGLLPRKVRAGTADMTTGPAMTREEAIAALEVGIETARDLVAAGNKALLTGEMGIANTTASAALISVFTGADPAEVTGRGTGINDETLARKTEVVRRAIDFHQPDPADPIGVLAAIGGLEHAAMVGLLLGGASLRTPVILDGVSAGAAALVARAIAPEVLAACIAGHRSAEPGHVAALNKLGLRPLIDLDLRLGEGTGALLALPIVQSAARAMHEVATFDSAGVTEK